MDSRLLQLRAMAASEFRRTNLESLIQEYGTIERLSDLSDQSPSYISQVRNGTRNMGNKVARKVESELGLPAGWMDLDHQGQRPTDTVPVELTYFRKLSREQREAVVLILRSMASKR